MVVDAVGSIAHVGNERDVTAMVARQIDLMKARGTTFLFTALTPGSGQETSDVGVSSLTDTWLDLRNIERDAERNRLLYVIKSRGLAHSNQVREFRLSHQGIELLDVMVGPDGVVTGSARQREEQRLIAEGESLEAGLEQKRRALEAKRTAVEAQIAALRSGLDADIAATEAAIAEEQRRQLAQRSRRSALELQREGQDA